jgi:hypothetical protein
MTGPVTVGSVRIGGYVLEVGAFTESYAAFQPEREDRNVKALREALDDESAGLHAPVAALEKLQATAETVTRKCERARELSRAAAERRLLEADALMAEVDSLLRLAERLDRDGRFDEELRLLRALHGLLVLACRWLDLIRALRRAVGAAEQAGDLAAQAWVRHELGSLYLCADEPEAGAERLRQARQLQQRLGQTIGTCATRHNLESAERDTAAATAMEPWSRRLLRLAGVVGVVTLLAGGGAAIAFAQGDDPPSPTAPTSTGGTDTTTGSTAAGGPTTGNNATTDPTTGTTGTTGTVDITEPVVALDTPFEGSAVPTQTPEFSGTAGVEPGDIAEVLVEIVDERGGPLAGSPLHAPIAGGAWTVTPTFALPDGSYQATAKQSDTAENTGSSATVTFIVDTAAPGLRLACDPFDLGTLTTSCELSSTEAGTASFKFTEHRLVREGDKVVEESVELTQPQTVELEPNTTQKFVLTLPDEDLNQPSVRIVGFAIVAVQSDAAGNLGVSEPAEIRPRRPPPVR